MAAACGRHARRPFGEIIRRWSSTTSPAARPWLRWQRSKRPARPTTPCAIVRQDGRTVSPPDYRRISPHGRVPALVDGDVTLHESAAIVLHVGERFPGSGLLPPAATAERSDLYRWLMYLTNTVQATFMFWFYPERVVGADDAAASALVAGVERQLNEMFDWIESSLEPGAHLLGDRFSGADLYLHMLTRWGRNLDRPPWTLRGRRRPLPAPLGAPLGGADARAPGDRRLPRRLIPYKNIANCGIGACTGLGAPIPCPQRR